MLRWYQTVLGARLVHSDGMLAFLSYHERFTSDVRWIFVF